MITSLLVLYLIFMIGQNVYQRHSDLLMSQSLMLKPTNKQRLELKKEAEQFAQYANWMAVGSLISFVFLTALVLKQCLY